MARPGLRVGLLGGSFDPPHLGHVFLSTEALKRFGLDEVWWLVSPGNPLKAVGPAPMARRITAARAMLSHPRIQVTDIEAQLNTRYTAETLRRLQALYRGVDFVWLMGADNLASFHKWDRWRWILNTVPVGVIARPGDRISARTSPAAVQFKAHRLRGRAAMRLARSHPPAWCFVNVPMKAISSTEIRNRGDWAREG